MGIDHKNDSLKERCLIIFNLFRTRLFFHIIKGFIHNYIQLHHLQFAWLEIWCLYET